MTAIRIFLSYLADLGLDERQDTVEQRRIRMTNTSALIGVAILVTSGTMNFFISDPVNGLKLITGIVVLYVPVLYLNKIERILSARLYLALSTIVFANYIGFNSIFEMEQRFNEFLLIGVAAFVLFLYDGYLKVVMFLICYLSGTGLHIYRWVHTEPTIHSDLILSLTNMTIAFGCVYVFSAVFKSELTKALAKEKERSHEIEEQKGIIEEKTLILRSVLDNLPMFIAMVDTKGKYLMVNTWYQDAFQVKVSGIEGRYASEFLSEKMNLLHQKFISQVLSGQESEFDREVVINTGERFHLYGKMLPIRNKDEEIVALIEFGTDVTKLKKAEEELQHANDQKNRLFTILAHDIRSPLSQFEMLIKIGLDGKMDPEQFNSFLITLEERFQPLNKTINGLLDWARIQMDGLEPNIEIFDPTTVYRDVIIELEAIKLQKDIKIKMVGDMDMSQVKMDCEHLKIAFRNLLHNALKFTPRGGHITIAQINGPTRQLRITDTGPGISDKLITQIARNQIVRSTPGSDGEKGTGLGVSLVKSLLEKNGCSLCIEKEEGGTTFIIEFAEFSIKKESSQYENSSVN